MKSSLFPAVGITGAVFAVFVYSISSQDPYWRLAGGERLAATAPVPAYEATGGPKTVMVAEMPSFSNDDTGAAGASAPAPTPDPVTELAALNYTVPVEDGPLLVDHRDVALGTGPGTVEIPRVFDLALPTLLVPSDSLGSVEAPAQPLQPRLASSDVTEESLELKYSERLEVQRRLALAGFDPRGFDGVFGPNTRAAITDFQNAWGFPATGFLDEAVFGDLKSRTEGAMLAMRRRAASTPSAEPELAAAPEAPSKDGCARNAQGRIIERQSIKCDLAGFSESFASYGRSDINSDGSTGNTSVFAPRSGANR